MLIFPSKFNINVNFLKIYPSNVTGAVPSSCFRLLIGIVGCLVFQKSQDLFMAPSAFLDCCQDLLILDLFLLFPQPVQLIETCIIFLFCSLCLFFCTCDLFFNRDRSSCHLHQPPVFDIRPCCASGCR